MVGISDVQGLKDPLWLTENKVHWKSAKHSYKMQTTPLLIFFPLCGSSENIKPDEWFQIFWYFCDQSQRVLRWEEQRRRKGKKKKTKSLFELVVSVPIPNNKIQFWIQFKTPHSYLQGLERLGPHHLHHHVTTFTVYGLIHWLAMLSISK